MHPVVIGTAGHIDHGKTELVRALTGIDCDRLKEEKERGITTDIGFAYLDYPDGVRLAFIDVPGHERFVHNMLAGACGIDVVLLVVAADESIKPQTREHAEICRLLGVRRGVIALSKVDLVDAETLEVVRLEVQEFAAGGALPQAQVVPVSARTQQGLEQLKEALRRAAESAPVRDASRPVRLPVDRVFSARGFGTVVTGTLWSGRLRCEREVEIIPAGRRARVRGLQVHHQAVGEALAGQRAAVNLQGLNLDAMTRGAVIMEPGAFRPAKVLLAWLELVPEIGQRKRPTPLGLHHGTLETTARWRWLGEPTRGKGVVSGPAALYCQQAVAAVRGDHFVLRRRSPASTIGGGEVLDTLARARKPAEMAEHAGRIRGAGALEALLEDLRWAREPAVEERRLWIRSGVGRRGFEEALARAREQGRVVEVGKSLWAQSARLKDLQRRALELVGSFHERDRLQAGMPLEEFKRRLLAGAPRELVEWFLKTMQSSGALRVDGGRVARAGHQVELSAEEERLARTLEREFRKGGLNPPELEQVRSCCQAPPGLVERIVHLLVRSGRIVRIRSGRLYHAEALRGLLESLRKQRERSPRIDVGRFKELTGTSRKNAIPLLEHLDAMRVTQRVGNERIIL